jgi:hypothetical protein
MKIEVFAGNQIIPNRPQEFRVHISVIAFPPMIVATSGSDPSELTIQIKCNAKLTPRFILIGFRGQEAPSRRADNDSLKAKNRPRNNSSVIQWK